MYLQCPMTNWLKCNRVFFIIVSVGDLIFKSVLPIVLKYYFMRYSKKYKLQNVFNPAVISNWTKLLVHVIYTCMNNTLSSKTFKAAKSALL